MAFYTDPIILEFAAGLLIARAWTSGVTVPVKAASLVTLLGFALLVAGSETTLPRIVAAGIPAFLIVAGAVFSESRYKLQSVADAGAAGRRVLFDLSVACHRAAGHRQAVGWPLGLDGGGLLGLAFVVVAMTASACAGVVLYKLVERPLLQWLSGKKRSGQGAAAWPSRRNCRH